VNGTVVCISDLLCRLQVTAVISLQPVCCFLSGKQSCVLCQCSACWSRWNTEPYAACCTGDIRLGSVSCISRKYVANLFWKLAGL